MVNMACHGGTAEVASNIFENKCRLCGGTAIRKNHFFSDAGKFLGMKWIIFTLCEIVVISETNELPKYCCRSCYEKLTCVNRNIEAFASACKSCPESSRGRTHNK